ncbi:MAG: ribosomal L7Ae/L30e/S12e/Gadd45 family protein [Clostridia bacterium]|nr:ribosomal L7Ae/L30e/S12e/Gadd45 family protein [Clostridia bacterium]
MFTENEKTGLVVGLKQTKKAIKDGVQRVLLAEDAADMIKSEILALYPNVEYVESMSELGRMCSIDVKAAVAAVKN